MRLLLMTQYFPPEIGAASHLFYEIARGLCRRNHDVTVATSFPWYNVEDAPDGYRGRKFMREEMDGLKVIRMASPWLPNGKIRLAGNHLLAPPAIAMGGLFSEKPDAIFVYSPPIFMAWGVVLARMWGIPFIFGVQDLFPQAHIDLGVIKDPLSIAFFRAAESMAYRLSDRITVHSEGNRDYLVKNRDVSSSKISILPNWIDTEHIKPSERNNDFSEKHGLDGRFSVSNAGTFGISQGSMTAVEAAILLRDRKDIHFLLAGGGVDTIAMRERISAEKLLNVTMIPMQPMDVYPKLLAASDASMSTLRADVKTPVVPSKILSIMAAGRPVLAGVPFDGDAHRLIMDSGCGVNVGPQNPKALADTIVAWEKDRAVGAKMGAQGRAYVERHFTVDRTAEKLERLISDAILELANGKRRKQ